MNPIDQIEFDNLNIVTQARKWLDKNMTDTPPQFRGHIVTGYCVGYRQACEDVIDLLKGWTSDVES